MRLIIVLAVILAVCVWWKSPNLFMTEVPGLTATCNSTNIKTHITKYNIKSIIQQTSGFDRKNIKECATLERGSIVNLEWDNSPNDVNIFIDNIELQTENNSIQIPFTAGIYNVKVDCKWGDSSAEYTFRIEVI